MAFVSSIDDDGTLFQMSVNLDLFEDDENEAYLTMAHAFSAFVFDLDVDPALDDKVDRMAERSGLAEFRDRAIDAGLTPLENNFERCG